MLAGVKLKKYDIYRPLIGKANGHLEIPNEVC
jgi:hypothetical protein